MDRLQHFLTVDDAARAKAAWIGMAAGITFGLWLQWHGEDFTSAAYSAVAILAVTYTLRVWWYCKTVPAAAVERVNGRRHRVSRRLVMSFASWITILLVNIVPLPEAEAAILNRRLRALTKGEELSPQQAEKVGSLLNTAAAGPIKLPEDTRIQVYRAVKSSGLEYPNSQPFVEAAGSLVRYTRMVEPLPLGPQVSNIAGSSEAWAAYQRGAAYALTVLSGGMHLPTPEPRDARQAIAEFTRVIDLATEPQDRKLLSDAFMARATMHLYLEQFDDVLSDAEKAESKGNTDLSSLLDLEGIALYRRGHREDLERAICIFTLLLKVPPPTWVKLNDLRDTALFQIDALGNLSKIDYKLGKFEDAIRDTESLLDRIDNEQIVLQLGSQDMLYTLKLAYLQIIASYLQIGKIDQALTAARTWAGKTGDQDARFLILDLESGRFDRQRWLNGYMRPLA